MLTLGHTCTGSCICSWAEDQHGRDRVRVNPECPVAGHSEYVRTIAISPDGKRVVSGSKDNLVKIWDTTTGAEVSSFEGVR